MTMLMQRADGFADAVIDALSSHICVIDKDSVIVTVNRAWRNFTLENPPVSSCAGVGAHYLKICRSASGPASEGAQQFALGIESILEGKAELFQLEYPCHSPEVNRWFLGEVTPLRNRQRGAVISHMTITDRKLLELELARLASTDSLTGLPNRRYFLETANLEVERAGRFGVAASVAMIDVDRFKAVNDTYGHAAGDDALRCLAQVCRKALRHIDVLARIGGEEFAVLLPGTDEAGAVSVAEKLRQAVCKAQVGSGKDRFPISASFGVGAVRGGDRSVDACLGRADKALYAAKQAGRNCVMSFAAVPSEAQDTDAPTYC
ncbi:MAG TPA: diguanylate cyclase [Rhizomicrobium sp.]